MNKKKEAYRVPEVNLLRLSMQLNLLNSPSNPHQADFGELENQDEWV